MASKKKSLLEIFEELRNPGGFDPREDIGMMIDIIDLVEPKNRQAVLDGFAAFINNHTDYFLE